MDNAQKSQELPVRKRIRLPEFDYDSHGAYFITICTKDKSRVLSKIRVGTTINSPLYSDIVSLSDVFAI